MSSSHLFRTFAPGIVAMFVASLAPCALAQTGETDCDGSKPAFALKVAAALSYATDNSVPFRAACKAWAAHPGATLVALAYRRPDSPHSPDMPEAGIYDLDLLLVDSGSGDVRLHDRYPEEYPFRNERFDTLDIDTSDYPLTPGTHEFGLRFSSSRGTPNEPDASEGLALYVEADGHLRRVLEGVQMKRVIRQWDTRCEGLFKIEDSVLTVAQTRHHGWADLNLEVTQRRGYSMPEGDQCKETGETAWQRQYSAIYNGHEYELHDAPAE